MAWPGRGTPRDLNIGDEVRLQMPNETTCPHCKKKIAQDRNEQTAFYDGRQKVGGRMCDVYKYHMPPDCPHCGVEITRHAVPC